MTLLDAIRSNDAAKVARVLDEQPELAHTLNDPIPGGAFGQTALLAAVAEANRDTVDVLLRAGADINQKSHWWAGGFHVLDDAWREPWLPSFLIGRGATLEIHHAVRLGMMDEVRRMLSADPALVRARGGDGQLPLHFAQTVEMAEVLMSSGADVNARDVDHESTAAQWMVRDRQDVARYLVTRGVDVDLLMACALGDREHAARLLDARPDRIYTSVSEEWFPKRDPRAGGSIYIWTLGAYKTAHVIAREFGNDDVLRVLEERTPDDLKLSTACEHGDEATVRELLARRPDIAVTLRPSERRKLADAATNNNTTAVRLMLEAGWPVDARGQHNATALHWAAFHGNADMTRLLLRYHAPVNVRGDEFDGTPLGWAEYGSHHGWHRATGDYPGTIAILIAAGAVREGQS
jgi:ankyrin repeat protein